MEDYINDANMASQTSNELHHVLIDNDVKHLYDLAIRFSANSLSCLVPWQAQLLYFTLEYRYEDITALRTLYAVDLGVLLEKHGYNEFALFFYEKADKLGFVHGAYHTRDYERALEIYRHLFEFRYDGLDYIPYPDESVRAHLNTADRLYYAGDVKASCEEYKIAIDILNRADAIICVHEIETNNPLFFRKSGIQEVGTDYIRVKDGLPIGESDGTTCLTYDDLCNPNEDDDNHSYTDYLIRESEDEVTNLISVQEAQHENLLRWQTYLENPELIKQSIAISIRVHMREVFSLVVEDDIIVSTTTKGTFIFFIDCGGFIHHTFLSK